MLTLTLYLLSVSVVWETFLKSPAIQDGVNTPGLPNNFGNVLFFSARD